MNHQREAFKEKVAEHMKSGAAPPEGESGGGKETKIEHHGDGTHTVHHADGEKSGPHPSMGHAAMHLAGKHDGGEHGHIMPHAGGGATTHHIDMGGEVHGPDEHPSEQEGYSHLQGNIGEGAGMEPGNEGGMGQGAEDSSFE